MASELVKLYRLLILDIDLGSAATLTLTTENLTVTRAIAATSGRRPVKVRLPFNCKGRYAKVKILPTGKTRLFGMTLYGRRLPNGQEMSWQWAPGPVEETPEVWIKVELPIPATPEEWTDQPLPIPATPNEWTDQPLPIPPTPNEWTEQALPVPPTPEDWREQALPIPATPEEWASLKLPIPTTPDEQEWSDLPVDA